MKGERLMYLHIGNGMLVDTKNIVGVFDIDNTTVSRQGKGFLPEAQKNGQIIYATEDLPKSFIVTKNKDNTKIYISSVSTQVLNRRCMENDIT